MRILIKFWFIIKIRKVSYIDVYATMADIIGTKRKCNEAPDSRSLLKLIEDDDKELRPNHILHHAVDWIMGNSGGAALRRGDYKWIPATEELFNVANDVGETKNLFQKRPDIVANYNETLNEFVTRIKLREERTQEGRLDIC